MLPTPTERCCFIAYSYTCSEEQILELESEIERLRVENRDLERDRSVRYPLVPHSPEVSTARYDHCILYIATLKHSNLGGHNEIHLSMSQDSQSNLLRHLACSNS